MRIDPRGSRSPAVAAQSVAMETLVPVNGTSQPQRLAVQGGQNPGASQQIGLMKSCLFFGKKFCRRNQERFLGRKDLVLQRLQLQNDRSRNSVFLEIVQVLFSEEKEIDRGMSGLAEQVDEKLVQLTV